MRFTTVGKWLVLALIVLIGACDQPMAPGTVEDGAIGISDRPLFSSAGGDDVIVPVSGDTYLKQGSHNQNQGALETLRIRQSGKNRALVQFDQGDIEAAVGGGDLISARLEFTIADNGDNWGTDGRTIDVHRMIQGWTELGATWNCADDLDLSNQRPDCPDTEWEMGKKNQPELHPWFEIPTATALIMKYQEGVVTFDVTEDVQSFLSGAEPNLGWLIRKTIEGAAGRIEFGSKESTTPPVLVLEVMTTPWCNAALDFDQGILPTDWTLSLIGSGPGLVHDRLEGQPVAGGAWVMAAGDAPAGLDEIVVEYRALHVYSFWGMHHGPALVTRDGVEYQIQDGNDRDDWGEKNLAIRVVKYFPEGGHEILPDSVKAPFEYGEIHHRVAIGDEYVSWTALDLDGNYIFRDQVIPVPGLFLNDVVEFKYWVYAKTDNGTWADDLTVSCVR